MYENGTLLAAYRSAFDHCSETVGVSAAEEHSLIHSAQSGDVNAKNRLVGQHIRWVVHIARRYVGTRVCLDDLVQEGVLGLLEAIRRFNPEAGVRLSTYATHWIRMCISKYAAENAGPVSVPVGVVQLRGSITKAMQELADKSGQAPTPEELAQFLEVSVERLAEVAASRWIQVNVNDEQFDPVDPDSSPLTCAEDAIKERCIAALAALKKLGPTDRRLVLNRIAEWGKPKKKGRERISNELGVCLERVRQLEVEATRKLLRLIEDDLVDDPSLIVSSEAQACLI